MSDSFRSDVAPEDEAPRPSGIVETSEASRAAGHLREDVLAVLAHDMNTALHVIKLAAMSLSRSNTTGLVASTSERIALVVRTTEWLHRLTEDLTDLALLDGGRLSLVAAPYDPNEVLEMAAAELVPLASEKSMLVRIARVRPVVYGRGDRERLLQVLMNLGGNAVKFGPHGSTVVLTAEIEADRFRFSVSDEGPGVPAALRERVFRAGVRAPRVAGGGSGLGLAIARTVIELMGGSMRVEPVDPRGARFVFDVPRALGSG